MQNFKFIDGGVTSPRGFTAQGVCASIRPSNKTKRDLALIYCETPCSAAAVFTKNLVKSSAIDVTRDHLKNGVAQAIIVNSGNANTCNADGSEVAEKMCSIAAEALGVSSGDVIVASTGVIGQPLNMDPIVKGVEMMKGRLCKGGGTNVAEAIMTTDTVKKEMALETTIGEKKVTIGVVAKGSGMIHINMGTMLSFVTTDAAISAKMLREALLEAVDVSYNMVSVDGDTSTNDTLAIMASGLAGNVEITKRNDDYRVFVSALTALCKKAAKKLAGDGEGATKLLVCKVSSAKSTADAKIVAKSVVCSSLLKAAMFGADANWGRVLCAVGYSGANIDIKKIDVSFSSDAGRVSVCRNGVGIDFSEKAAKTVLLEKEIDIDICLNEGEFYAEAYGCDLTYDYVRINGDYRT